MTLIKGRVLEVYPATWGSNVNAEQTVGDLVDEITLPSGELDVQKVMSMLEEFASKEQYRQFEEDLAAMFFPELPCDVDSYRELVREEDRLDGCE